MDIYTPNVPTLGALSTAFIFVDEASRNINVQLVHNKKCSVFPLDKFLAFQREVLGTRPHRFHSDNGTEFTKNEFKARLASLEINQSFSDPEVKQQNGLVKRTVQHLINTVNAILRSSGLPISLWNEVMQSDSHLINIRFKPKLQSSPFKLYHRLLAVSRSPPYYRHLRRSPCSVGQAESVRQQGDQNAPG